MVIGLIASPFVEVPPQRYGETELFVANLAVGIKDVGHEVMVYANGESKLPVEVRWLYPQSLWPLTGDFSETLTEINHTAWAIRDAADFCDVIHVNSVHGLPPSRFCRSPFVYTIHHGHDQAMSEFYSYHIEWDEPFEFVMVEAIACGTPVLALPGGAVAEIVSDGVSGYFASC